MNRATPSTSRDDLTRWISDEVRRRVAPSPFSRETQDVISRYAPPDPVGERQLKELALVTGHALMLVAFVAVWATAAWVSSKSGDRHVAQDTIRVGWAVTAGLLAGMTLHLLRYYDALARKLRGRGPGTRSRAWPVASSDYDFLVQTLVAVLAAVHGAPR